MTISTRAGLVAAAETWLARSSLSGEMPTLLALAEQRIHDGSQEPGFETLPLRTRLMAAEADLTPDGGSVSLPDRFLSAIELLDTERRPIRMVPERARHAACAEVVAAIVGDRIELHPAAAAPGEIRLRYFRSFAPLIADEDTNELLVRAPSIYLSAMLAEGFHLVRNIEVAQTWLARFRASTRAFVEAERLGGVGGIDWIVSPDRAAY